MGLPFLWGVFVAGVGAIGVGASVAAAAAVILACLLHGAFMRILLTLRECGTKGGNGLRQRGPQILGLGVCVPFSDLIWLTVRRWTGGGNAPEGG